MVDCWNCRERIPEASRRCPHCGSSQNIVGSSDEEITFHRPEDAGLESEVSYENMFMKGESTSSKDAERCPVCFSEMKYKEKVNSWFCPRCKQFF